LEGIQSPAIARAMARRCNSSNAGAKAYTTTTTTTSCVVDIGGTAAAAQPIPRRKPASFFFHNLDSSISHAFRKAVKKFDLTR
jgi:hypothetical protein